MTELEIELKGKITDLTAKLKQAESALKKTGEAADQTADKTEGVGKGASGLNKVETAAASLVGSFIGSGGIINAVDLAIKTVEVLNQRGNKISSTLEALSGGVDVLTEAQRDFAEATQKGVAAAESEIVTLGILLDAARDEARSKAERAEALDRINDEYGKLIPNLNLENVGTEKVTKAVDALNASLIREAKIRGAQSLIAKETQKLLEEQEKSALDAANGWDILAAAARATRGFGPGLNNTINALGSKRQRDEIAKSEARIKSFTETLRGLLSEDLSFDRITIKPPKVETTVIKPPKVETTVANTFTDDELASIFGITDAGQKALEDRAAKVSQRLSDAIAKDLTAEPVKAYLSEIEQNLIQFNENTRSLVETSITDTFVGIGEAIGEALAGGGNILQAVGSAVVGAFGAFLSDMGELMIQYGTLAVTKGILDRVIASGGPQSIIAGAAAIAVGVALSAAGSAIQNRAAGGSAQSVAGQGSSPGAIPSGTSSGSTAGFGGGGGNGRVVFEIAGTKLLGVLENTQGSNLRIGGSTG